MKNKFIEDFAVFFKACYLLVIVALFGLFTIPANADECVITLQEGENFWGGCVTDGGQMPFGKTSFECDLYGDTRGNQAQALLISDQGRYVWCEQPFEFSFDGTELKVESRHGKIKTGQHGNSLRDVFQYVSQTYFPSTGEIPDQMLFVKPQYNTWIELIYDQRESRIRKYAKDIIDNGFPAGVLMIDDNWQEDYGVWEFHPGRFKNPKDMMNNLHEQGFKVMLWICPYFSPDCETYRLLNKKGYFLKDKRGGTYMCRWWNGYSASLDLTNPEAVKYFQGRLAYLCDTYGVDGFKLDAGDAKAYGDKNIKASQDISPNEFSELWAKLGLPFKLNEYRACWKLAGQPLAQRLRDKGHNWEDLHQLIPDALAQGLMGYAYICPDMIGGGEYMYFYNKSGKSLDQELIVRSAQCSALMPMMQFSVAPWRVLSKENLAICRQMALLHEEMGPEILEMAKSASKTGEPVVRHLEYMYPHQGYAQINDQFMLGDKILVAPVLEKGARTRTIVFPPGTWKGDDGSVVTGPCTQKIDVPLERLPRYRLLSVRSFAQASLEDSRWPAEKANAWYKDKAWPIGCNFLPSTAVNPIEMWNADTFDPKTIDKELRWARDIGFNTVRVYVHFIVWQQDPEGLKDRMSDFLEIANAHGMTVMLILFDDCFIQDPVIGKQPPPKPGVHNSRWSASPGRELRKKEHWDKLEKYTKDIIGEFKDSSRILVWDLYNEPGDKSLELVENVFMWARSAKPSQPLTVGPFRKTFDGDVAKRFMELSDVISFHSYDNADIFRQKMEICESYGRPVFCTEWMARTDQSRFETHLPVMKKNKVAAYNWGLVAGKTQTYMPRRAKEGSPEPEEWFHDIFRKDGTAYDAKEVEFIKNTIKGNKLRCL